MNNGATQYHIYGINTFICVIILINKWLGNEAILQIPCLWYGKLPIMGESVQMLEGFLTR